jgi:hypothetical protein
MSKASPEGELFVDHRASPGIPPELARRMGYEDPHLVSEGKLLEAAILTCRHCRQPSIKNPLRTRERYFCMECGGAYICDPCNLERLQPNYTHMPFEKIVDLVATGKVTVECLGVRPLLIPTKPTEI